MTIFVFCYVNVFNLFITVFFLTVCLLSLSRVRAAMSEEAVRQTRSQKRALERDHAAHTGSLGDTDSKRVKLEKGDPTGTPLALVGAGTENVKLKSEQAAKVAASILKSGEVKATIKVELQTGEEAVDLSTSKR